MEQQKHSGNKQSTQYIKSNDNDNGSVYEKKGGIEKGKKCTPSSLYRLHGMLVEL